MLFLDLFQEISLHIKINYYENNQVNLGIGHYGYNGRLQ